MVTLFLFKFHLIFSVQDLECYLPILPVLSEPDAIYMMIKLHRALSPELQSKLKAILSNETSDTYKMTQS